MECSYEGCNRRNSLQEGFCRTHGYLRPDSPALATVNAGESVAISNDIKLELQKINTQLIKIQTGLRYEVNSLNSQVDELTVENSFLKAEISKLQGKSNTDFFARDAHQQHNRLENFRLHNEPEKKGEDCRDVIKKACERIGVTIADEDIQRCHRLGKPRTNGTNRQIICRLKWYGHKQKIMQNRKSLSPDTRNKNIEEKRRMLAGARFITEDLTPFRGKVFRYVKAWNDRNGKWDAVTTNYGKICCKVKDIDKKWDTISTTEDMFSFGIPYDDEFIKEFKNDIFIVT